MFTVEITPVKKNNNIKIQVARKMMDIWFEHRHTQVKKTNTYKSVCSDFQMLWSQKSYLKLLILSDNFFKPKSFCFKIFTCGSINCISHTLQNSLCTMMWITMTFGSEILKFFVWQRDWKLKICYLKLYLTIWKALSWNARDIGRI